MIGKRDAQSTGRIELDPFNRNVIMASIELLTMMRCKPKLLGRLIAECVRLWEEGKIKSACPRKSYNYSQLEEAFRLLQSGRGIGQNGPQAPG